MIYGGSGLGKTHLIQAIGNNIVERGTARKVMYATSEQFTADFIKAIQSGRSDSFGKLYRSVDVLRSSATRSGRLRRTPCEPFAMGPGERNYGP